MKPHTARYSLRFTLVAAFAGITLLASLIFSLVTTELVGNFVREEFRMRLSDLASVTASQIDVTAHHRLQLASDQSSPTYLALQKQLRTVRDHGTQIRFIYTMRRLIDGRIAFVVDAEENPAEFSKLGDIYADITPELSRTFDEAAGSQQAFVTNRFYTDAWGSWMSAYAPLRLPNGQLDAVIGIDISAENVIQKERRYQYLVWSVCALLTLLFMPLAYLIAQRIRRPLSQLEADMSRVGQFNLESSPTIRSRIIEISHMAQQLDAMKSGLRSFQKYVPADLVRRLMARGVDAEVGGSQQEVTIFMSDVEGFTQLAERLAPEALVKHLAEYLTEVTGSLMDTGATVDQYIGDAVLAFWNAPEAAPDHALRACAAALDAQARIASMNRLWAARGEQVAFKTRIGLNTGHVIVGNIGSAERLSYTIIGDQVNLVSRLESANKVYGTGILLSEHTQRLVQAVYATRLVDQVVAYGKSVPIKVFELLGLHGQMDTASQALIARYESAFALYQQRDFPAAMALLQANIANETPDAPSVVLHHRCQQFIAAPPHADWDGSFLLSSK